MKKVIVAALFLALCTAGAFGQTIVGSPHDLTDNTNNFYSTNQDQICIFCHTPHHASATQTPLWNRNNPVTDYPTYWSSTIDAYDAGSIPNVSGVSLMCLSCHDGVTALNSLLYEGSVGTPVMNADYITGDANLNDAEGLTNDHPVSFAYAASVSGGDGELVDEGTLPDWALHDGNVQCSSCHDVHDYGATADMQPFMNETKIGSAICLTCHVK